MTQKTKNRKWYQNIWALWESSRQILHLPLKAALHCILFVIVLDLLRQYSRQNIASLPFNSIPDISTLGPMRLLAACEDDGSELRKNLSHELYHNLWAEKKGNFHSQIWRCGLCIILCLDRFYFLNDDWITQGAKGASQNNSRKQNKRHSLDCFLDFFSYFWLFL